MTNTPEAPRVLTVDGDQKWSNALEKRFKTKKIEYKQTKDTAAALEALNAGDFTAVIMDGLQGDWRTIVDTARELGVRPIVLSRSAFAVGAAIAEGVVAGHKNRFLTREDIDPIVEAATQSEDPQLNTLTQ